MSLDFDTDIRPLFRDEDVSCMSRRFDLNSQVAVLANSDRILERLNRVEEAGGAMPKTGGRWPQANIDKLEQWITENKS